MKYVLVRIGDDGFPLFWVDGRKWSVEYPDAMFSKSAPLARSYRRVIEQRYPDLAGQIRIVGDYGLNSEVTLDA